jgi:hypothetical protein
VEEQYMSLSGTKNSELIGYIERSIVDIARKCNVDNTSVIETFKKIYIKKL